MLFMLLARLHLRSLGPDGDWDGEWDCGTAWTHDNACSGMKDARKIFGSGKWHKYLKKCQRCRCKKVKGKTGDWNNFKRGKCNEPVTCNKK